MDHSTWIWTIQIYKYTYIHIQNFSYRTVHSIGLPVLLYEIYILQAHRLQSRIQLKIFNSKRIWSQTCIQGMKED